MYPSLTWSPRVSMTLPDSVMVAERLALAAAETGRSRAWAGTAHAEQTASASHTVPAVAGEVTKHRVRPRLGPSRLATGGIMSMGGLTVNRLVAPVPAGSIVADRPADS
jgi:hypothetical protein